MLLIDEIVSFDETARELTAATTIRPEWRENWSAIELMAQASAALAGMSDKLAGHVGPARPGFLLGTRRLTLEVPAFEAGKRYLVTAKDVFGDDEAASFECTVRDGETVVARATLNTFRPRDVAVFLAEQNAV